MKKILRLFIFLIIVVNTTASAQGNWTAIADSAPDYNNGVMLLLTNGTVMCLTSDSSGMNSQEGNTWDLLTPDSTGSYANGTWTRLPQMHDTRLYSPTWVMPDGNVYVAGGEYGTGYGTAELFNTNTQTWTYINGVPPNYIVFDGSSENLPDGTILQGALYNYDFGNDLQTLVYKESAGSYSIGPLLSGSHEEVSWVKLPDGSIMNIDALQLTSERYIPSLKKWIADSNLKNRVMDFTAGEMGPGFLLPNGKLLFLSDSTYTAIYTPSGDTSKGTWTQGPAMPISASGLNLGCPDAPAAMMPNGKILCVLAQQGSYSGPGFFYEFDYTNNTFTQVSCPGGGVGDSISWLPSYACTMLNLPDGTILFSILGDNHYYQYTPSGSPLASGKPVINNIISNCPNFTITGKLFNGISEGSAYGDDWQMSTNYPIVRLTKGSKVYYAKTTNWNRIGAVMTDSLEDTASFLIPPMPVGTYSVQVIANGIASSPYSLTVTCTTVGIQSITADNTSISIYPNPSNGVFTIESPVNYNGGLMKVYNELGELILSKKLNGGYNSINLGSQPGGVYNYTIQDADGNFTSRGKLVVRK